MSAARRELIDCPLKCSRGRHYPGHPHLEGVAHEESETAREPSGNVRIIDAPASVSGAPSAEVLAAQAQAAIASEQKRAPQIKPKEQREVEERAARLAAMKPLARKLATAPYTAVALATFDERWMQIKEQEIAALEQATLNVMFAWGIEFSGKWSSVSALAFCHAEIIALKAKQIYEEEKEKKKRSNAVTQEIPKSEVPPLPKA